MYRTAVKKIVLDANDALVQANRHQFDHAGNYVVSMMSSPGAGRRPCWSARWNACAATCVWGCWRATCRRPWTPTVSRASTSRWCR